jgi:translation initiation factor 2B subunit (eIF-2B alpha/beta/delta family)
VPASRSSAECPQKSFQRKIHPWLISDGGRHPDYETMYKNLKEEVIQYFSHAPNQGMFTPHDESHCQNVEKMTKVIVTKSEIDLSGTERFLLSCAAWTHDLGMNEEVADGYFREVKGRNTPIEPEEIRKEHHNASCWFLQSRYEKLFDSTRGGSSGKPGKDEEERIIAVVRAISTIIQFHRKKEDIGKCAEHLTIKGEVVRLKLLAAIFRLADTLHKDTSRFDPNAWPVLNMVSFGRESRLHWLKSFVVSNIHLNESEQVITIQLDLPDFTQFEDWNGNRGPESRDKMLKDWDDNVRGLRHIISADIEEDLVVVNRIFSRYRMPTYVTVDVRLSLVRGFTRERYHEIKGIMSDLDIILSPNTSKVIRRTLDSLKSLCAANTTGDSFRSLLDQLLKYLREIHESRPCHVGLGKIIKLLEKLPSADSSEELRRKINLFVQRIEKSRSEAIEKILNRADAIVPESVSEIFLIGFSETISGLLKKIAECRPHSSGKIQIYVMECATKRRLGHSNLIEYNDGIHYASEIAKLGYYQVSLIPDLGFATLLQLRKQQSPQEWNPAEKQLVLCGVNGIDENSAVCGHTSGHLSVAIIAQKYSVPVRVLADSFKFGDLGSATNEGRKSEWLTSQPKYVEQLESANVTRTNFREDQFPAEYVQGIYTDECALIFNSDDFKQQLTSVMESAASFYRELSDLAEST